MKQRSLARNRLRRLGWLRFLLQLGSVAAVYLGVSVAIPMGFVFASGLDASQYRLGNAAVLSSAFVSMVAALLVARWWLARDGCLQQAWNVRPPVNLRRTLWLAVLGTGAVIALFVLGAMAVEALGLPKADIGLITDLATASPASFILWIVLVAWLTAGLGEELLFRGFLLDRLMRLRGWRGRRWPAAIIQAVLFGLPHLYQGWGGVLVTGTIGLFLAWLRFANRGNLWACILAHAAVDTIMLTLAYSESLGWLN